MKVSLWYKLYSLEIVWKLDSVVYFADVRIGKFTEVLGSI